MISSYLKLLNQELTNHLANNLKPPKIAIIGIGNELNGDDAAGIIVARKINQTLVAPDRLYVVEGSIAPENFTAPIRRFQPDWIWLIDAANFNCLPGSIQLIGMDEIDGVSFSTHGLPLPVFANYLKAETNASIILFGIQPLSTNSFSEISEIVKLSIDKFSGNLISWLKKNIIN